MVSTPAVVAVTAIAMLASTGVNGHGTLSKPGLKFTGTGYGGNFPALVPMTALTAQPGDKFTNYPDASLNAAAFDRAFKASKYKTLKEFLLANQDLSLGRTTMPKTPECGFTDPTGGAVQPLPDQVEWYGGKMNHNGPCEIWCDDDVVLPFAADCSVEYPEGKFPYDKSKCVGKNRLTLYWLATLLEWQVYIDCAKIGAGGASATTTTTTTTNTTTSTTTPATATPAITTTNGNTGNTGNTGNNNSNNGNSGSRHQQCRRERSTKRHLLS